MVRNWHEITEHYYCYAGQNEYCAKQVKEEIFFKWEMGKSSAEQAKAFLRLYYSIRTKPKQRDDYL